MTVSYTAQVATSSFSCFLKLLARWRGSIYKLLWRDFAVYVAIYFILSFIYRFALNEYQRRIFEMLSHYCASNNALIPVAFILGFYVTLIMTRYWSCLGHIPWPDHMAMFVTANVQGLDERTRMIRRTMMRYLCLAYAMTMSAISPAVKKRFPSYNHLVDAGFLTKNEQRSLEEINTPHNLFFIPLAWTTRLVFTARKERKIDDEFAVKTLIDEINQFRMHLASLFVYDWITVPLVYTQVVTIAVYMFFLSTLMGRQFLKDDPEVTDLYFPFFTFLEYFFYMGWLKVAECLVNPFGEDEEDFDVNFLIDRNLQVSYIIVDEVYNKPPDLVRDQYWDETHFDLPYTIAAEPFRKQCFTGSAVDISLSVKDAEYTMSAPREDMGTIMEAGSQEELDDSDPDVGSAPLQSFIQSSVTRGGSVLKRIFSRQESKTSHHPHRESVVSQRRSRGSSAANSPEPPHQQDDLQFNLDEENPEVDADDSQLIEKCRRESNAIAIPLQKMRSAQSKGESSAGSSPSKSPPQSEKKVSIASQLSAAGPTLYGSSDPTTAGVSDDGAASASVAESPFAWMEGIELHQTTPETFVPAWTKGKEKSPAAANYTRDAVAVVSPPTEAVNTGDAVAVMSPPTKAANARDAVAVMSTPTEAASTGDAVAVDVSPRTGPRLWTERRTSDTGKTIVDVTTYSGGAVPETPNSPDTASPIWVLASSRINLAIQREEQESLHEEEKIGLLKDDQPKT